MLDLLEVLLRNKLGLYLFDDLNSIGKVRLNKHYPEAATNMFNRAMGLVKDGNLHNAMQYFTLSIEYEPRALTHLERGRLGLTMGWLDRCEEDVEAGLKLCAESNDTNIDELVKRLTELKVELAPLLAEERKIGRHHKALAAEMERLADAGKTFELLSLTGLSEWQSALMSLTEPSTRITMSKECAPNAPISRFGGIPSVTADFDWPITEVGVPLAFLCQLDLSSLRDFYGGTLLPKNGLLSFFYDDDEWPGGYEPGIYSGWKVILFPQTDCLVEPTVPRLYPRYREFAPHDLTFSDEFTFPAFDSEEIETLNMPELELDKYSTFCDYWHRTTKPVNRLFGHAQTIQSDLKTEFLSQASEHASPRNIDYISESRLLLQIDSGDPTNMEWGDGGRLFFCIDQPNLLAGDFSQVWVSMQCY